MENFRSLTRRLALALVVMFSLGSIASGAEVVLRAQSALPRHHDLVKSYLDLFVKRLNAEGKGVIQVKYVGGPEVTPARKAASALKRGVFDMLHSPAAYYAGITPQSLALMATNRTPAEVRANGGFDIIAKVWKKKLNAKIIAWGESGAQFHLYLKKKPPINSKGHLDLTGFKMRYTGAYKALLRNLGAATVQMPVSDVYTALQRGVVDGFGWPTVGLGALGLAKAVKYRIDPPFYHLANLVLVNLDKWNSLSSQARAILTRVGLEYETASIARMKQAGRDDGAIVMKAGVEVIRLSGPAADHYLKAAFDGMWERIGSRLSKQETATWRAKMLRE